MSKHNSDYGTTINGFTVVPVGYTSSAPSTVHYMYIRRHSGSGGGNKGKTKEKQFPEGRTLFVVNVPPDATEREVVVFFKYAGTVEKVMFGFEGDRENDEESEDESEEMDEDEEDDESDEGEDEQGTKKERKKNKEKGPPKVEPLPTMGTRKLRKTGQTAHVVFLDESSLERAIWLAVSATSTTKPSKPRPWPSSATPIGLSHYHALYAALRPPLDAVRTHADTYIQAYDWQAKQDAQRGASKYRRGEAVVDEDGFTLVVRGGAYGKTMGGGMGVASRQFQTLAGTGKAAGSGRKRKEKGGGSKEGFYAFHKAERQRNELIELRKKWEADKAKIEKQKASRKFKPY
ncbi:hypothetical protein AMATHDRAFT_80981 [Amanita thiersii Skay4041]|uniref:RRM domain-containing protein n=1 Tax=Amanita thiersii Skay4041 TaxID=703135 RepID=A0A2A9NLF6_9AGAR|nr:hypothetical protein AMATHDRAFT_80981 [Amanita thiersii Skay4041]